MSPAAVRSPLAPSVLYHLGPRDTHGSEQMAQRLRSGQSLLYDHVSVKGAKAAATLGGVAKQRSPGPEGVADSSAKRALDLLVAKNRVTSVLPYAFQLLMCSGWDFESEGEGLTMSPESSGHLRMRLSFFSGMQEKEDNVSPPPPSYIPSDLTTKGFAQPEPALPCHLNLLRDLDGS